MQKAVANVYKHEILKALYSYNSAVEGFFVFISLEKNTQLKLCCCFFFLLLKKCYNIYFSTNEVVKYRFNKHITCFSIIKEIKNKIKNNDNNIFYYFIKFLF